MFLSKREMTDAELSQSFRNLEADVKRLQDRAARDNDVERHRALKSINLKLYVASRELDDYRATS